MILNYMKRSVNAVDELAVHPREVDMPNRVLAVRATAGSMQPLGLFDGVHMKKYLRSLDPKHSPPHRLERIRLLEVFIDGGMLELNRIVQVCCAVEYSLEKNMT